MVIGALVGSFARRRGWKKNSPWRMRQQAEAEEMEHVKGRIRAQGGEALVEDMEKASVWGVKGGLQVLTETLREKLEAEGVEFWMGEKGKVEHVEQVEGGWQVSPSECFRVEGVLTSLPLFHRFAHLQVLSKPRSSSRPSRNFSLRPSRLPLFPPRPSVSSTSPSRSPHQAHLRFTQPASATLSLELSRPP